MSIGASTAKLLIRWSLILILALTGCLQTPAALSTAPATPTRPLVDQGTTCKDIEILPPASPDAQQIVEEFVASYREQYPTEYMGMAILSRVYRLGDWALVTGSISGEGDDVIAVHRSPGALSPRYQIADFIHVAPLELPAELQTWVVQPFLDKLPEAPPALFTCMEPSWLQPDEPAGKTPGVFQLSYISTDNFTTEGVTEIKTVFSDGINPSVLLHVPMLVMGLAPSPDGERIAFWGCPGSLSSDCSEGEDLDVWAVDWDGLNLTNLTGDSSQDDSHPSWSPDGTRIVFESWRSGRAQLYLMRADGSGVRQLTDGAGDNREPRWSPDGEWIAYHCTKVGEIGIETRICVISPEGQPAGEPLAGTTPVWSPANPEDGARLAFLCFQGIQSDICMVHPDGSELINLTNSPADEHSHAWSPDGGWLAFVSNRGNDVDIYKVCIACPGEPSVVRLSDEPRPSGQLSWSPDGSQLAYVSAGDLLLVNADRSGVTYLASGVFSPPVWRP